MQKGFSDFKKHAKRSLLIKCLLCGLASALVCTAVVLLLYKLAVIPLLLWLIVAAVLGPLLLCGGICYLVNRDTDKSLAKRIDTEYALGEKVQTMVAFEGDSGDVVTLQRMDTEERLSAMPKKKLPERRFWVYIASAVLASLMLVTTLIIPTKTVEPPHYELSEWQATALAELIEMVESSDMQEDVKTSVASDLRGLVGALPGAVDDEGARIMALATVYKIDATLKAANAAPEMGAAMLNGSMANFEPLAIPLASLDMDGIAKALSELRRNFGGSGVGDALASLSAELSGILQQSDVMSDNGIYAVLQAWATELAALGSQAGSYSAAWVQEKLDNCFTYATNELLDEVRQQATNKNVGDIVINRLAVIFDIPQSDLPGDERIPGQGGEGEDDPGNTGKDDDPNQEPDKKPDDDKINTGGYGSGDMILGSDDIIYFPDENKFVSYGEVLNAYNNRVLEKLMNSNLSEEEKEYITVYFTQLYSGIKEKD